MRCPPVGRSGSVALAAVPPGPAHLGVERVEPVRPPVAERLEPAVELGQRRGVEGVDALAAHGVGPHEPGLAQHPEVPADRRTADREALGDRTGRARLGPQHLEDVAPDRIGDRTGHEHGGSVTDSLHVVLRGLTASIRNRLECATKGPSRSIRSCSSRRRSSKRSTLKPGTIHTTSRRKYTTAPTSSKVIRSRSDRMSRTSRPTAPAASAARRGSRSDDAGSGPSSASLSSRTLCGPTCCEK